MKERNSAIELLRILLMFGICVIHVVGKGAYSQRWLANLLKISVPGFVFITGWYGIKFSWRKVVKLYAIAAYCALVGMCGWAFMQAEVGPIEWRSLCGQWMADMKWFWFLHSYVVLLMVAPMLNIAVEKAALMQVKDGEGSIVLPFLIVVFGWAFLAGIGHAKSYVFGVHGFETHSPLSLAGMYVAARYFKLKGMENRFSSKQLLVVWLVCSPLAMVGLANYNSPIALIMVAALFLLFKRHVKVGVWVNAVAPSMFSVYMLHSTSVGLTLITCAENALMANGWNVYWMFFVVSSVVFFTGIFVDSIRRLMVVLWTKGLQ